ncbi:hypothetical protein [Brachybacterium paraconglomeratum]|uniref:hypothetical protein n=1 Tax=Brachybacterium paraconglomeratum TaxID=173362 RepID=UPI003F7C85CF
MSTADGAPAPATSAAGRSAEGAYSAVASPTRRPWASGRWSLEVRGDELADIRCDGRLVLRAVRAVARDDDWATAWPSSVDVTADDDGITLDLRIQDLGLDLAGTLRVRADDSAGAGNGANGAGPADGDRLVVDLDLEAVTDSSTNRIGLVVLHPPQLAGTPLQVAHPDGRVSELAFPVQVSPHQPAKEIAGLAWEAGGLPLRLDLVGEVFEMEDQRNWTDASYKTYSRPLDLPFPYLLAAGEHVRQSLVLAAGAAATSESGEPVSGAAPSASRATSADATPTAGAASQTDGAPGAHGAEAEELTWHRGGPAPSIGTGHLDLELADPDWPERLDAALENASTSLSLWIVSPSPADTSALAELGRRLAAAVEHGALLRFAGIADATRHVTTPELAEALRALLPEGVPVVAGARSHFTELNREWDTVLASEPSALAFATTPLFHTLETEQLIEAIAMQRLLVEQLTARAPDLPVHVGPITLRPRFANVATRPQPIPAPAPTVDPRAGTVLHEAWTIASAAALAVPGVMSLTYEQAPAELRALGRESTPRRSATGHPVENGAVDARSRGGALVTARSEDGLLWAIGDGHTLLLANLSPRPRSIRLPGRQGPLSLDPASWRADPPVPVTG